MTDRRQDLLARLRTTGADGALAARLRREIERGGDHGLSEAPVEPQYTPGVPTLRAVRNDPYSYADLTWLQAMTVPRGNYAVRIGSLDELMDRR